MIADEIYELVKGDKPLYIPDGDNGETRRVSYRDIAVLMRSVKKNAKAFEEAFAERGIPLFVESESGYFDAIEISTLLDMLAPVPLHLQAVNEGLLQVHNPDGNYRSPLAYQAGY